MEEEGKRRQGEVYILESWPSASHFGDFAGALFFRSRRAWRSQVGRRRSRDPWLVGCKQVKLMEEFERIGGHKIRS